MTLMNDPLFGSILVKPCNALVYVMLNTCARYLMFSLIFLAYDLNQRAHKNTHSYVLLIKDSPTGQTSEFGMIIQLNPP